jgi:hypothetical protein
MSAYNTQGANQEPRLHPRQRLLLLRCLFDLDDVQAYTWDELYVGSVNIWAVRTRRKTLLQLLGLFWVIDGEGVEVPRTP